MFVLLLMVVHDLNVRGALRIRWPLETDPPLLIDADRILAFPVTAQRFQPVAG
jgi:hypothetical protein